MIETTGKNVLMRCEVCAYEEYASESDLALLRHLLPASKEDKMVCLICLNNMYRATSFRFYKPDDTNKQ